MRRLRAGRKTRTARPSTKFIRGIRCRLDYAWVAREVEIVVRRENDKFASVDNSRRACRPFQRPTPAREPGRLPCVKRIRKTVESARRICRGRNHRDVIDEDRSLFKKLNRLCDSVARPAIQEDAPAVRVALFLEDGDSRLDIVDDMISITHYVEHSDPERLVYFMLLSVWQSNYPQSDGSYESTLWSIVYNPEDHWADFYFKEDEGAYTLFLNDEDEFVSPMWSEAADEQDEDKPFWRIFQ